MLQNVLSQPWPYVIATPYQTPPEQPIKVFAPSRPPPVNHHVERYF